MDKRITCSQIRSFCKCLRRHYLEYILGIRPTQQAHYFRFGGAFHDALDLRTKGQLEEDAITNALKGYDDFCEYDILIEKEILICILKGYFWRWQNMDSKIEVVESELSFELPIEHPLTGEKHELSICGKIDKIVCLPDGRMAIMEHKTTSDDLDPAGNYFKRLRIDLQISIYTLAAKMMGYPIETVLYDVVRKPTTKPKQLTQAQTQHLVKTGKYLGKLSGLEYAYGCYDVNFDENELTVIVNSELAEVKKGARGFSVTETLSMYANRLLAEMCDRYDNFYARREIARLDSDMQDTKLMLWQYAQMISRCNQDGCWPMNDSSCVGFGTCPYFDLCNCGYDPFDNFYVPEHFIQVSDVHQEL